MELPKCECFQTGDEFCTILAKSRCSAIANEMGNAMVRGANETSMCNATLPFIMDISIINMAVIVALKDTIIEMGTQEAERETVRVLTGIEERVIALAREIYAEARERGVTAETVRAMREKQFGDGK